MTERNDSRSPFDPVKVLRSLSMPDVSDQIAEVNHLSEFDSGVQSRKAPPKLSSSPEDFVVLDGQKIKVTRSIFNMSKKLGASYDGWDGERSTNSTAPHHAIENDSGESVSILKQALANSDRIVARQNKEIIKYVTRIEQLEQYIASLGVDSNALTLLGIKHQAAMLPLNGDLTTPTNKTTEVNVVANPQLTSSNRPPKRFFPSPELVTKTKNGQEEAKKEHELKEDVLQCDVVLEQQYRKLPNQLAARLALGSTERRKMGSTNSSLSSQKGSLARHIDANADVEMSPENQLLFLQNVDSPAVSETGSASGGGNKSVGRKQLRRKPSGMSTPNTNGAGGDSASQTSSSMDLSPPRPLFRWKDTATVCIFIAHDNPQISKTVATQLSALANNLCLSSKHSSKGSGNVSRAAGMPIMLESKGKGDATHFLIGDIIYSGDYAHVEDAVLSNSRGSECLVVTNLRAVRHPIKQFATRDSHTNKEVIEINLVDLPAESSVDVTSISKLSDFLTHCRARVDCILDPYHSQNTWYPYYEGRCSSNAATHRKMAPQFRSQGIGYIRLGDDMSNFGIAFISLDAGATYLDNGATSIVDHGTSSNNLFATFPGNAPPSSTAAADGNSALHSSTLGGGCLSQLIDAKQPLIRRTSSKNLRNIVMSSRPSGEGSEEVPVSARSQQPHRQQLNTMDIPELLQALKDSSLKWAQRTQILSSLFASLSNFSLAIGEAKSADPRHDSFFLDLLGTLQENLTKQKNPLVVSATLQCIGTLTYGELLSCQFGMAWRSLVLETMHMLRNNNKQISETVLSTLNGLHKAKSVSFGYLSGLMADILSGPHSKNSNSSGGSNISKIVSWLDSSAKIDIAACVRYVAFVEASCACAADMCVDPVPPVETETRGIFAGTLPKLLKKFIPLLSHREEATRENVIALIATYLSQHILYKHCQVSGFASVAQVIAASCDSAETLHLTLLRVVADVELVEVLETLQKVALRSCEKVVIATAQAVSRIANDLKNIGAQLLAAAKPLNQSAPTNIADPSAVKSSLGLLRATSAKGGSLSRGGSRKSGRPPMDNNSNSNSNGQSAQLDGQDSSVAGSGHSPTTYDSDGVEVFSSGQGHETSDVPHGSGHRSPRAALQHAIAQDSVVNSGAAQVNSPDEQTAVVSRVPRISSRSKLGGGKGVLRASPKNGVELPGSGSIATISNNAPCSGLLTALSDSWYEVRLLLKQVPVSEKDWAGLCKIIKDSPAFFSSLASAAQSISCPVGSVLRAVLPFDEDTSSSDQSAVNQAKHNSTIYSETVSSLPAGDLQLLRTQASDFRRNIRVKMADEADLKQAMVASGLLNRFVTDLEAVCLSDSCGLSAVIGQLERSLL